MVNFLRNFTDTYHIHSRVPPGNICDVKPGQIAEKERFDYDKLIDPSKVRVIYLYRKPIYTLLSTYSSNIIHFNNIEVSSDNITILKNLGFTDRSGVLPEVIDRYLSLDRDPIDFEGFFDNYTQRQLNINYDILCLKYSGLFRKMGEVLDFIGISRSLDKYYPPYQEKVYDSGIIKKSEKFFSGINIKIDSMPELCIKNGSYR